MAKKIDVRTLSPKTQEILRFIAIRAIEDGKTQAEAAHLVGVQRTTVTYWWKLYREGGEEALRIKRRGRPKGGKLKGWQAATIVNLIKEKCPDQLNLPWVLWTRESVRELIKRRFGIELALTTVGRYLRRWGFSGKKPIRRAFERNPVAVEGWLHREYPKIRFKARKEDAEIQWCDEMGVRSDHQTGTSWNPIGEKPVVYETGKRFSCNMISSISNYGTLRFKLFEGIFTVKVFLDFLERLIKSTDRKIFLIVDNHSVHRAKAVKKWISEHLDHIELFFLPPYAPDLNTDEYLNNDVKSNAIGRRRSSTKDEMKRNLNSYFRSTQCQSQIVRSYFKAKAGRYAA